MSYQNNLEEMRISDEALRHRLYPVVMILLSLYPSYLFLNLKKILRDVPVMFGPSVEVSSLIDEWNAYIFPSHSRSHFYPII